MLKTVNLLFGYVGRNFSFRGRIFLRVLWQEGGVLIRTSQGWKGKGFLGALVILITFGALAFASGSHQAFNIAYAVVIDGEEIGLVQDQAEVHMALGEIEKCAAAECGLEVELASAPVIQCRHLSEDESAQAAFLSAEELRDRLSENVILTAPAVAIIVDGVTAVGVPDERQPQT